MNNFKTIALTIISIFFLITQADCAFGDFENAFSKKPKKLKT